MVEKRDRFQTWPELWLKRIVATLNSPFAETLVVDSDVYACPTFERLFDTYKSNLTITTTSRMRALVSCSFDSTCLLFPSNFFFLKRYLGDNDVALTLAAAPFGSSRNYDGAFRPGFPVSYAQFVERNLGLQLLATGRPSVQQLVTLFRDAYVRQSNDVEHVSIGNDQSAFREALFTLKDGLKVQEIPEVRNHIHQKKTKKNRERNPEEKKQKKEGKGRNG